MGPVELIQGIDVDAFIDLVLIIGLNCLLVYFVVDRGFFRWPKWKRS